MNRRINIKSIDFYLFIITDVETPVYCPPNFPYIDKKDNDNLGDRCLVQPQIPSHCLANSNPDDYSGKFCRMLDLTVSCKWTCPVGCYVDEPKTYNNCIMAGTKGESKLPCRVPGKLVCK